MKGLDISEFQDGLSLSAVKNAGYDFVILRGGFTGWGTGVSYNKDSCFERFYKEAKENGLNVGCYWYSCANTAQKGENEAKYLYENCLKGKQFEYPIYLDVEDNHHQANNKKGVTDAIIAFCEYLEDLGYFVGVYASEYWFNTKIETYRLKAYTKWLACWTSKKPVEPFSYAVWQNSNSGSVSGKRVDTDLAYEDFPSTIKANGLNGFNKKPVAPTPEPKPTPKPATLKAGDAVQIIGVGNSQASGKGRTAYGIGWNRKILNVYEGYEFPYQVGNSTGTTGFYQAKALKKL